MRAGDYVDEFRQSYDALSRTGACDTPGALEYGRVLREALQVSPTLSGDELARFIRWRANVGPWGGPSGWEREGPPPDEEQIRKCWTERRSQGHAP